MSVDTVEASLVKGDEQPLSWQGEGRSRESNRGCYWKGRLGCRELESAAVELLQDLMQIRDADWVGLDAVGESSVGRSILVADWSCWLEW
ncbi:hypothetical protein F0562_025773 [Nyssa sinensis]|uniref:Uncharacterized protein n=1 Tax=Nyssa sinensis TaxID=561372 RepID=A0A5J5BCZ4_9ASTE|nr:hypothetical protein F0562_025773 [Nyssa sinensis]